MREMDATAQKIVPSLPKAEMETATKAAELFNTKGADSSGG
jgi:hypothetical protein